MIIHDHVLCKCRSCMMCLQECRKAAYWFESSGWNRLRFGCFEVLVPCKAGYVLPICQHYSIQIILKQLNNAHVHDWTLSLELHVKNFKYRWQTKTEFKSDEDAKKLPMSYIDQYHAKIMRLHWNPMFIDIDIELISWRFQRDPHKILKQFMQLKYL